MQSRVPGKTSNGPAMQRLSRAEFLGLGAAAAGSVLLGALTGPAGGAMAATEKIRTRPIPKTAEQMPVIGLGTWQAFDIGKPCFDLARLRRRAFSVRAEPVDLEETALAAFERYEQASRSFGVELQVLAEPDAVATGDGDRLLQALSNLVENALRSTPRGGSVRIVARPGRLEVVDDGPGLAEVDLGRAFERFYLYDRYEGERRVGTGLGLAIVHELVSAMAGTAEVHSEPGAGTTFAIQLPLPPRPQAARETPPEFVRVARSRSTNE